MLADRTEAWPNAGSLAPQLERGKPDEVAGYALPKSIEVRWIEDGDHSLKPRKRSGRDEQQNLDEAVEAISEFVKTISNPGTGH